MATIHPFSTSQSDFRTSQNNAPPQTFSYIDSPLTTLPTLTFQFDDLRRRMTDFTQKFDAYIERGRKRVFEERNDFRARLSELNEDQKSSAMQITTLNQALTSHAQTIQRETHEKSEMQAQIATLESHAAAQRLHRDKLLQTIASTQRTIDAKVQAQREYADKIDAQASLNGPELTFWETYLGTKIEGGGDESLIRVRYVFAPERGATEEREAMFELKVPDVGSGGYEVEYARPRLDEAKVGKVVDRLNETRDIAVLLKGMRGLFQEEMGERLAAR